MKKNNNNRIELILKQITRLANLDFKARGKISEKGDEMDSVVLGLNTLGEELTSFSKELILKEKRITEITSILIQNAQLDFSKNIRISEKGDDLDAIALGINTMVEELNSVIKKLIEKDELIASIIVHAPDAVIIIDEQSIITEWNPKAESIFGWKREEAVGKYLHETIIPLQYRTAHIKGLKHYLSYGEGPVLNKPIELSALRKDNTEFDCGLTISPFILKGKKYFISFLRDISQKKKNEEKLKKLTNDLTESNIELEQFAYIASHDLQEPLRMVSSYVQMLANRFSDKLGDDGNDFINFAVDGAKRMRLLIQGLLDYSRVNTIKQYEPINTNKLVEDVLKDLMMVIKDKKVSIKVENLPDVFGNYVLISHLFQNLISNAIKFQSQRKPEILVSGKNTNGQILFSIKDNGIGIEKEYFDKIFIIFSRLHSKDKYPGTGIGLAICKKIVQKHGGKIWVESKFRKGSTFYFTLADH